MQTAVHSGAQNTKNVRIIIHFPCFPTKVTKILLKAPKTVFSSNCVYFELHSGQFTFFHQSIEELDEIYVNLPKF